MAVEARSFGGEGLQARRQPSCGRPGCASPDVEGGLGVALGGRLGPYDLA